MDGRATLHQGLIRTERTSAADLGVALTQVSEILHLQKAHLQQVSLQQVCHTVIPFGLTLTCF